MLLTISLILNVILLTGGLKNNHQGSTSDFLGIWFAGNVYYAFADNNEVYKFSISDASSGNFDLLPEHKYMYQCSKGHLDENNTIIFSDYYEFKSNESRLYYYNVYDLEYSPRAVVGPKVNRESSEILTIGDYKCMQTHEYDYVLTSDYEPTHTCSWDTQDYYLHVVKPDGTVLASITQCNLKYGYASSAHAFLQFETDKTSENQLVAALNSDPEQQVIVDFAGSTLYSGPLSNLERCDEYTFNTTHYFCLPTDTLPENYEVLFSHLK